MNHFNRWCPRVLGSVVLLLLVAGSPSLVAAGTSQPAPLPPTGANTTVVDATQMATVVDIVQRIEPYLYVGSDGLVRMAEVSASELGVTEQFLADYRRAMDYSNALITRGEIRVNPDLSVSLLRSTPDPSAYAAPDAAGGNLAGDEVALSPYREVTPDWAGWNYGQGAMFFNTYEDWTYYRYNYYGLCNGMAAWIGMPRMGPVLILFYGYNQYYFVAYCYPGYGTYFYIPYSYIDYPFGYKPAYFWARQWGYCGPCRCYCYQWMWLGFWLRY